MRMKLWAGRTSNSGTEVVFPIFDLLPSEYAIPSAQQLNWSYTVTTPQSEVISFESLYIFATDAANLYKLFPADIPKKSSDEGNIIMLNGAMEYDSAANTYIIPDSEFTPISGTEPDNWLTARYKYYFCYNNDSIPTYRRYSNVRTNATTLTDQVSPFTGAPTVFDPSVTYYYNNSSDPRNDICQLYTAATGSSFGILRNYDAFGDSYVTIGGIFTENNDTYYNQSYGYNTPFWYSPFGINPYSVYPPNYVKMLYNVDYPVSGLPTANTKAITIFVSYEYNGKMFYGMAIVTMSDRTDSARPIAIQAQLFTAEFWGDSIISGGSSGGNWGADTVISGGNGTFTADSNTHGDGTGQDIGNSVGQLNGFSAIFTAGGINVYKIATQGSPVTIATIINVLFSDNFLLKFKNYMYNPLSSILSAHLLPNKFVSLTGGARSLTAGGYNISNEIAAASTVAIANQYTWCHVGKISIDLFSDSYADYAPYTSMRLHLPYIGEIDIDINKCMNGQLSVDYVCDSISGNVAAFVWVKDKDGVCTYAYTATGNAAYSYPMFSESQSGAAVGKLIGATASGIVGIATGNPLGVLGAAMGGIDAVMQQRNTQVSGTFSGNVGALIACFANGLCYVDITRPVWANPSNFAELKGLISNLAGTLNDSGDGTGYAGFVKVSDCDLDGIPATETEKIEIENLLKNGIFVVVEE